MRKNSNWGWSIALILLGILGAVGLTMASFMVGTGPFGLLFGVGFCIYCQIKAKKIMDGE